MRPGDINFGLFTRANRLLSSILDEVLESRIVVPPEPMDPDPTASVFGSEINRALSEGEINLLDTTDFRIFDQWLF